jgi:dienelactone hydrolase
LYVLQTTTLTDEQFLTGAHEGKPTTIAGELRLPRLGTDRIPAVVIVHGSGGIMGNEDRWSRELNDMGVATFVLDGFTGRGITNTAYDQSQLGNLTMIYDAYRALELLAKHPRIDATRIGILGGSRGGRVALYASLKRFQRAYGPAANEFAVYLAFYAPCYTTYLEDTDLADRPIRLFHGSADDYTPAAPCRSYVERLRRAGKNVQLTEYAGAYHLFDNPIYPLGRAAEAQTARSCTLEESSVGHIVGRDNGRSFTLEDPCVERGVTVGYDAGAHAQAIKDVKAVLNQVFKLGLP